MDMRAQGASWTAVGAALKREPVNCANRWYRVKRGAAARATAYWEWDEDEALRREWAKRRPDLDALAAELQRPVSSLIDRARVLRLVSRMTKRDAGDGSGIRKCHDCGKPTHDHRCPACLRRWRQLHGVCLGGGGDEEGA